MKIANCGFTAHLTQLLEPSPDGEIRVGKAYEAIRVKGNDVCSYIAKKPRLVMSLDQLMKAGTAVGANYHEANRAESRSDFIHKIGLVGKEVEKEAAESQYWLICVTKQT